MVMGNPLMTAPGATAWNTVAQFDDYAAAQRAVDRLSDEGYPVQALDVIGTGLRLVERITGRLTKARAAAAGAVSGGWIGLMIGILLGLFSSAPAWLGLLAAGIGLGALWGAVFGFAAHWATRGQRDFASVRGLTAARYDLIVREGGLAGAEQARELLSRAGLLPPG